MRKQYWIGMIALVACGTAFGASFDCAKASNQIEKTICADKQLSEIDETMATAYKKALSSASDAQATKASQRAWLINERNKCQDAACLLAAYKTRLAELSGGDSKAGGNEASIVGRIECGRQTCSIIAENGELLMFEVNASVGKRILQACKIDDICEVRGVVQNEDVLTSVSKVQKRKDSQQSAPQSQQESQGNGVVTPAVAKMSPEEEQEAALKKHWDDPLTIDYAQTVKGIGGAQRKERPAAGTVRKMALGQYLNWERSAKNEWQFKLWNAMGMQNKNAVYNQCLQEVTQQWVNAFGYRETALRSSIFINGSVDLDKALRIVCAPS